MTLIRTLVCSVLICLTFSFHAIGQESIDLLTLSGKYGLPQSYDDLPSEKATEATTLVNLKLPIVFNKRTIWYSNITYTYSTVQNNLAFSDSMANPIQLHGFILQTGLVQRIDDNNAFQILFVPRFMSDLENPGGNPWQFGAIGLFEHRYGPNLTMRYGVMYNNEKSGALLVPLVDVNWKMSKKWSVTGLLPIYGKVNYHINPDFTAGVSLFGLITSYDLTADNYAGDYMERTSIDLTLFARHRLFGNFFGEARFGYALGRTYAQYHDDDKIDLRISLFKIGDDRGEPVNYAFQDGLIFNLRLVYNLPIESETER